MKKAILASAIIAGTAFHPQVSQAVELETKQAGVATAGIVAGALAGGPVGMLAAFIGTIYVTEQMENNEEAKQLEREFLSSQQELHNLNRELHAANTTISEFETITLDQLQLQVMFKTGEDTLNPQNAKALTTLATFLQDNPELTVSLDGYADPRGTDEYNNVLSQYRADTVKTALLKAGIDESRIRINAHGASTTQAVIGDYETYALERRVDIKIINPTDLASVAQAH
ncbi:OmpA family protein [Gilvimarinus sp. SDUM040013]|uniref:OmpA family protein n=1 Tax=Gilvimarinus gilvus TaxID=3058038 RepID=A0ABU4RXU1_9GAMM|nr:OmpA family protein [Gilvimarinus sp. SDUM040013]MDO3387277.1 OmpA family protein [Gilvimarinus sp. SDUM040013]MDX6848966.1 OmpA family protein [Gilvimarinus sp. SDUM040013]